MIMIMILLLMMMLSVYHKEQSSTVRDTDKQYHSFKKISTRKVGAYNVFKL